MRVDDGLVLRGKGTSPADTSPLAMLTGDHAYEIEVDVTVEPGVEAGLLLFFNNRLFCGMGIDGERMLSYSGGIRTHWREPAPATDRITLRIRNDEHIVTGWYRVPGGEWTRHAIRYETSGYHVNTVGDLLSLRPALYATGDGRGALPRLHLSETQMNPATRPWTLSTEAPFVLRRDGEPTLLVGGQVFNSASSSPKAIADSFAHVRRVGSNVVLSPVSWALSEPAEGTFDFSLVDVMLAEARKNELRLVLLWFGAFKNAASTYCAHVGAQRTRRGSRAWWSSRRACRPSRYEGATAKPVLSVFSPELREADAKAFEALIRHLVDADPDGTVVMVQVENESGTALRQPRPQRARRGGVGSPRAVRADRARARDAGGQHVRPAALGVERQRRERIVVAGLRRHARGGRGLHGVGDRDLRRAPRGSRPGDRRHPDVRERVARSAARPGHARPVPERWSGIHRARCLAGRGSVARVPRPRHLCARRRRGDDSSMRPASSPSSFRSAV